MNHSHEPIPGLPPALTIFLSSLFMFLSMVVPQLAEVAPWRVPPGIMDIFQICAWSCAIGTFCIAILNYFGIKWNPFKRKGKRN
mgnify:CR=1 FL=1